MDRAATFDETGAARLRLERRWGLSSPYVVFVMLNPSTADAFKEDPTIRRCIGFAKLWQYSRMVVVNLFDLRATDPKELKTARKPVGDQNDLYIREACREADIVVCAWGVHGVIRNRNKGAWVRAIREDHHKVYCLGTTKDGHPKHPLYLPKDARLLPFNMDDPD